MRHVPVRMLLAACVAAALALPAIAREAAPPGSFLKYRAASVQELSSQLASEPEVLARYTRHFDTPRERLSAFIASDLHLVTLKSPLKVQMWYIGRDGKSHSKSKLLPKGTMVFATRDNKPVLSWSCGNPMRADLPIIEAKAKEPETAVVKPAEGETVAAVTPAQPAPVVVEPSTAVAANPLEATAAAAITAAPAPAAAAAVPIAAPVVVEAAAVPAVAAIPPVVAAAAPGLGWLGALAGLGGIAAIAGGGGGGGSPAPAPIPEPSTVVVLITGLASTAACGLRQLRVRR